MIKLLNVNKQYKLENGCVNALKDINLELPNTGFYSILGKSGSGKTTLINCIAGIDRVTSGDIFYNNVNIAQAKGAKLDDYRSNISFIFQDFNLIGEYTVKENIALSIRIQGKDTKNIDNVVKDALKSVELEGYENRRITELSGGEQQRVVIARALAKNSNVIFCDEPTGNLDDQTSIEIFDILKDLSKTRLIVLVSHNTELAEKYSDGIIEISEGSIVRNNLPKETSKEEVVNSSKNKLNLGMSLKLCAEQLFSMKFYVLLMLLVFVCTFTLFTISKSISKFDEVDALLETLKGNEQTVVELTNYTDIATKVESEDGVFYNYGFKIDDTRNLDKVNINDLIKIVSGKGSIYQSYFYYKPFNTFSNVEYPYQLDNNDSDHIFHYHAFNFEEMIAVDDFSNFSMPLVCGSIPQKENEVLIYDYMADNLLYHHVFEGDGIEDVVGKIITDNTQGYDLKISGIIKSNYQAYEYVDGTYYLDVLLGADYLSSLKCIYANKSLANKLKKNIISISGVELIMRTYNEDYEFDSETRETQNIFKSMKFIEDKIDYVAVSNLDGVESGIVLTESQVGAILGLNRKATTEEINNFMKNFQAEDGKFWDLQYSMYLVGDASTLSAYESYEEYLYGVCKDSVFNDDISVCHTIGSTQRTDGNSNRKVYLSLNKDYSYAKELLSSLYVKAHDESYYYDCLENETYFSEYGYCVNDFSGELIKQASEYLNKAKTISNDVTYLCYALIVALIVGFCYYSIKKQSYKIGILKSLGTKNSSIGIAFVASIILISVLAYVISIGVSYIAMDSITSKFINSTENIKLVIFSISKENLTSPLFINLVVALLTSLVVYVLFTINPPVMMIRQNKER